MDTRLNSVDVVLTNYYENMLVTMMKWRAAVASLRRNGSFRLTNRAFLRRTPHTRCALPSIQRLFCLT